MSPPPSRTFVPARPYTPSVMMGVGVGLLLNHHASASTSTVNGPRVPAPGLPLCAYATPLTSNGTASAAAITFRIGNLPWTRPWLAPCSDRNRRQDAVRQGAPGQVLGV